MLDLTKSPDSPKEVRNYPRGIAAMGCIERPHLGMKMYAVDQITRECEEVTMKTISLPQNRTVSHSYSNDITVTETHGQVVFDEKKYYCWAINKKNAVRKYVEALEAAMLK